jgi:uncharacterized membrane protein YgcG
MAIVTLYVVMYAYVLVSTVRGIRRAAQQQRMMDSMLGGVTDRPAPATEEEAEAEPSLKIARPIAFKRRQYYSFLTLLLLSMAANVMVIVMEEEDVSYLVTLSVYEVLDMVLICALLFLFRPRPVSPFYFVELFDPAAVEETQNQLQLHSEMKTFDIMSNPGGGGGGGGGGFGSGSGSGSGEKEEGKGNPADFGGRAGGGDVVVDIETMPLLPPRGGSSSNAQEQQQPLAPARLVVVRNPDALMLGIRHVSAAEGSSQ